MLRGRDMIGRNIGCIHQHVMFALALSSKPLPPPKDYTLASPRPLPTPASPSVRPSTLRLRSRSRIGLHVVAGCPGRPMGSFASIRPPVRPSVRPPVLMCDRRRGTADEYSRDAAARTRRARILRL